MTKVPLTWVAERYIHPALSGDLAGLDEEEIEIFKRWKENHTLLEVYTSVGNEEMQTDAVSGWADWCCKCLVLDKIKSIDEVAEWTCDKYSVGSLQDLEEKFGFEFNRWADVLVIGDLSSLEETDYENLGEVYRAYEDDDCRCVAWAALLDIYKVFEDFDEATQWVERMAFYRLRDEWPEEVPSYEVMKTIQKLQGIVTY